MRQLTGAALKKKRTQLGYSQAALAELLGVNVMSLSRWERELHRIPMAVILALPHFRAKEKVQPPTAEVKIKQTK